MSEPTTRRALLRQATALGAALAFGQSCAHTPTGPRTERRDLYPQGVASGDPAPESVILWTRREPDAGASAHLLVVEVASDAAFTRIVARGDVEVSAATDWTCRFLAAGLRPAREYWYRFVDEAGNTSRVGRTITAPAASDDRPVRFAFVSCQDVTIGALNEYRRMIYALLFKHSLFSHRSCWFSQPPSAKLLALAPPGRHHPGRQRSSARSFSASAYW